jgi:hypothetical protein
MAAILRYSESEFVHGIFVCRFCLYTVQKSRKGPKNRWP